MMAALFRRTVCIPIYIVSHAFHLSTPSGLRKIQKEHAKNLVLYRYNSKFVATDSLVRHDLIAVTQRPVVNTPSNKISR